VAKAIQAPIFHVNGDDAEAVVHICRIAAEFRQRFKKDVVVDMFCYRRFGHNEGDEPAFTQPLMYKAIGAHKSVRTIYAQKLIDEGVVTAAEAERQDKDFQAYLEASSRRARTISRTRPTGWKAPGRVWMPPATITCAATPRDAGTASPGRRCPGPCTGRLCTQPENHAPIEGQGTALRTGEGIDWATARRWPLAHCCSRAYRFGCRGRIRDAATFSQRHAVLFDQETESRHIPLTSIKGAQASFEVHGQSAIGSRVLGFEYGYTLAEPHALVAVGGAVGDFANGAAGHHRSVHRLGRIQMAAHVGLVMLLPHGYEGRGPSIPQPGWNAICSCRQKTIGRS